MGDSIDRMIVERNTAQAVRSPKFETSHGMLCHEIRLVHHMMSVAEETAYVIRYRRMLKSK